MALTERSEVIRVGLYQKIEKGLTFEEAQCVFRDDLTRYRDVLVHQHRVIKFDGDGDVPARLGQMLAIYEAFNRDFAVNGFDGYMDVDYVGSFDKRFASLNQEARDHLRAMLSRAGDIPDNLLREAEDALRRVGLPSTPERAHGARRMPREQRDRGWRARPRSLPAARAPQDCEGRRA
jgi:hypothetical protein